MIFPIVLRPHGPSLGTSARKVRPGRCLGGFFILTVLLLLASPGRLAATASDGPRYTAQHRPRTAVAVFEDTNQSAESARYGHSLSAMLITYFKTKGQLTVVERQDLDKLVEEWRRLEIGDVQARLQTPTPLPELVDVVITGKVTLLPGDVLEVDAKMLAVEDARLLSAARQYGRVGCLRQVVDRLGADLERDFLRPFSGKLAIRFDGPANTRFFLTPVLHTAAPEDAKPPVELAVTIYPGTEHDTVEPWITQPTTYVIENLLAGWYSVRMERPGYHGREVDNSRYRALGKPANYQIEYCPSERSCTRRSGPPERHSPDWQKLLVHVRPLDVESFHPGQLDLDLMPKLGALVTKVTDAQGQLLPDARVLVRALDLEINRRQSTEADPMETPSGDDATDSPTSQEESLLEQRREQQERLATHWRGRHPRDLPVRQDCAFLQADRPPLVSYPAKKVRTGETFRGRDFPGGDLAFESYRGESLPIGQYQVMAWAPHHRPVERRVLVHSDLFAKPEQFRLERLTRPLQLGGKPDGVVILEGEITRHREELRGGVAVTRRLELPVDRYRLTATLPDFPDWRRQVDLLPDSAALPDFDAFADGRKAWVPPVATLVREEIKNRLWVGGRTEGFLQDPELYFQPDTAELLDRVLSFPESRREMAEFLGVNDDLQELEEHLQRIDLLLLDELDVARLQVLPRAQGVLHRWLAGGRALMAFVDRPGDYGDVLGVPLRIKKKGRDRRLHLEPGQVPGFRLRTQLDLRTRRSFPRLRRKERRNLAWKVLAVDHKNRPRLLEHGTPDSGGYRLVWLDSARGLAGDGRYEVLIQQAQRLSLIRQENLQQSDIWQPEGDLPAKIPPLDDKETKREEKERKHLEELRRLQAVHARLFLIKNEVLKRALAWARYQLYRRLDADPAELTRLRRELTGVPSGCDCPADDPRRKAAVR